ncbi:MAG TPA: tetratricopeptide repeat protein [Candidatus Obscuribacterales bacterium]
MAMNVDPMRKALNTTPSSSDTERTLGWKLLLETAKIGEKKGEYDKAEAMYQRALDIATMRLGEDHVIVAHILLQFAQCYEAQKKNDLAQPMYSRAREILANYTMELAKESGLM